MKKRVTALALLLCLTLTACGGEDSRGQATVLGRAADMREDAVLLTVDGREVPAWRYLYWLAYTCDRVRERYQESGLALDWSTPVSGGTLADYARDQALADTALYATVENWAERYGCALTEEDRAALSASWAEQAAAHGGEDGYLAELAELGLDRRRAEELAGVGVLYGKLYTLYLDEDSPLAPDAPALAAFAEEAGLLTVDRILVAAGGDREAARQKAAELFAQLNGAADQGAAFAALAAAGDDPAGPRTFLPGDGTLDSSLEAAAMALAEGQCSGILESEEGFSILRRLAADADALADGYFDHLLQSAAESALVETTEAYDALDAAAFDAALRTARESAADS
nr:peptidylprolyl isomerase [uncultured Oscillibacter sp.]